MMEFLADVQMFVMKKVGIFVDIHVPCLVFSSSIHATGVTDLADFAWINHLQGKG